MPKLSKMILKSSVCVGVALSAFLFAVAITSVSAKGGKAGHGPPMNMTCNGEPVKMSVYMAGMKECKKEMGPSTTPPSADDSDAASVDDGEAVVEAKKGGKKGSRKRDPGHNLCVKVCGMKKQKVLGDDGSYSSEGAAEFIQAAFPSAAQDAIQKVYDDCANDNSASFSMDDNCAGYRKFQGCIMLKTAEACGIDMKKMKGWKRGGKGKKGGTTTTTPSSDESE